MSRTNNLNTSDSDKTTSYFNNFYTSSFSVSQGVDDSIVSYFEKLTANTASAKSLAGAVIYTAKAQGLDPMEILHQFADLPLGQLNAYLVMFLNQNRVGTSYLGLSNRPAISKYTARTILP